MYEEGANDCQKAVICAPSFLRLKDLSLVLLFSPKVQSLIRCSPEYVLTTKRQVLNSCLHFFGETRC